MKRYSIIMYENSNGSYHEGLGSFNTDRIDMRLTLINQINLAREYMNREKGHAFKLIECPKLGYNERTVYKEYKLI